MDTSNIIEVYDIVKDDLKFITISSVRTRIILSLKEGDKNINQLKIQLDLKTSSVSHALKNLENADIIFKKGKNYSLSSLGKLYAVKSENLIKSYGAIKNNQKIWLNHLMEGIPSFLIKKIGCLSDSFIIESTPTDIIKPHTYYTQILSESDEIKVVSPIFYYPFFELYTGLGDKKAEIILTPLILDAMIKNMGKQKLEKAISSRNLKFLSINKDIRIVFTVTEKFLTLGLFLPDGLYDATMSLVTYDKDAIKWGEELYKYYLKEAEEINLEDICR
jgi:predicted transcriptional regulator